MIISKDNIDANYISCFTDYFHGDEESARACAYEIGRTANTMGIGILELATIHHRSLDVMLQKAKTKADILRTLNVAQQLLSESLASYEMTNRGFYESLERLDLSNKELEKEIAERKEAEETLKRSEEKYRTIVETATEGIWICDTDARTIFVNKRMAEMLGYSEEEMMGKTAYAFMDQGSRELAKFNLDRRIHGDRDMYEQKYIRKDGSTLWAIASAAPMLDKGGKVIASLGMIMDITERKKAEIALGESERRYRDLFSNMAEEVHFWKLDRDEGGRIKTWRLVDVNPPALKTWGRLNVEEIRGKTTDEIFGPGSTEHFMPVVQKIMTEGTPYSYEDYFPNLNKYFRFTSVPLGEYFITTGADITDIKQNEKSIGRYAEELASSNQELEAFSYSVSHDLRAPLRSMSGFSRMLLEDYGKKLDAQGRDYLDRIESSGQLMNQLVDDMLRLSRIGRAEMKFEAVNLSDLVQSIAEELRSTQPKRDSEFIIQSDVIAEGDKALLKILLHNLLENAWKYTAKVERAMIEFCAIETNGKIVYSIKDNGAGFDMTYRDKLFKAFQRLHSSADYPGTGIGLAIVQRIVNRHGGRTWAEAKVGAGATFYFTLQRN